MSKPIQPEVVSKGVQALIDEIKEKGVNAGRQESERIVADAESRAQWILGQANDQAAVVRKEAERDAAFIREAGNEALQLAMRDVLLRLHDEVAEHLTRELEMMVNKTLQNDDALLNVLKALVARLSGEQVPEAILLPATVVGMDELRSNPEALTKGQLPDLLCMALSHLLDAGVKVLASRDFPAGCVLQYENGRVTVELTEKVLAAALLEHIQPRFRAVLEGVVA